MNKRIAVVGLGQMGGRIAKTLLQRGWDIGVYDTSEVAVRDLASNGARPYDSLQALGAEHDTVLTVLPNAAIVKQVVLGENGLATGMKSGSLVIEMTTSEPTVTREIAAILSRQGVHMLDAPVSGGVKKAENGTLTIMVGGSDEVLQTAMPVLEHIGEQIIHVGGIGAGHIAKAVNNLITATTLAITSEGLALGVKMGVNAQKLLDVINSGSGRSASSERKFPDQVLSRKFEPGFSVALMCKDVGIALDMAHEAQSPVWVSKPVHELWKHAVEKGRGDMDHTAIALVVEELAGVEINAAP